MQQRSPISASGPDIYQPGCAFCEKDLLNPYILKETGIFRIVADHAPLLEGHILIVPRNHYSCYGDVPADHDKELKSLKEEVKRFFEQYYERIVYWEHGIFHQTVFHAHLHCFPFGDISYRLSEGLHEQLIQDQEEIRVWHREHGQYFYLEDAENATLFAPRNDAYTRIVRGILGRGVVEQSGIRHWRSAQQRQEEGKPLIKSVTARWHQFQQQEVEHAD